MTLLDLALWVKKHDRAAMASWSTRKVLDLLYWHRIKGTLLVVEDQGEPVGLVCWTRLPDADIESGARGYACWTRGDALARNVYVVLCIGHMRALWEGLKAMLGDWRECRFLAHRRGREVRYPARFADLLNSQPFATHEQA